MNEYDKVFKFMQEKDKILLELTGIHIFDKELFKADFESEHNLIYLRLFIGNLKLKITTDQEKLNKISNGDLCPWCTKYYQDNHEKPWIEDCYVCTFGIKYWICGKDNSLYSKIIHHYRNRMNMMNAVNGPHFINNEEIHNIIHELVKD